MFYTNCSSIVRVFFYVRVLPIECFVVMQSVREPWLGIYENIFMPLVSFSYLKIWRRSSLSKEAFLKDSTFFLKSSQNSYSQPFLLKSMYLNLHKLCYALQARPYSQLKGPSYFLFPLNIQKSLSVGLVDFYLLEVYFHPYFPKSGDGLSPSLMALTTSNPSFETTDFSTSAKD